MVGLGLERAVGRAITGIGLVRRCYHVRLPDLITRVAHGQRQELGLHGSHCQGSGQDSRVLRILVGVAEQYILINGGAVNA